MIFGTKSMGERQLRQGVKVHRPAGRSKGYVVALAAVLLMSGGFGLSSSALAASKHMKTGKVTSQPIGHWNFCKEHPGECAVKSRNTKAPKLTRKRWKEMVEVNQKANRSVEPISDQDLYGVEEHWTYPKHYGDCEDYVLLKRFMLIKKGWPESSLLMTVVKQSNGDGHAVLTVRTSRADFVLDNLEPKIRRWNKTPYKFLKRQSTKHSGRWTNIKDRRSVVAGY